MKKHQFITIVVLLSILILLLTALLIITIHYLNRIDFYTFDIYQGIKRLGTKGLGITSAISY